MWGDRAYPSTQVDRHAVLSTKKRSCRLRMKVGPNGSENRQKLQGVHVFVTTTDCGPSQVISFCLGVGGWEKK